MNEQRKTSELIGSIWLKPTDTLNYLLNNAPEKLVIPLFMLGGVVRSWDKAIERASEDADLFFNLGLATLIGLFFGWITYYIWAWALSVTAEWIGGKASPKNYRTILAWGLIPSICSLIIIGIQFNFFKEQLISDDIINTSSLMTTLFLLSLLVELALGIWSLVIIVKGISIIQNFSIGQSILNIILPILFIAIPIGAILLLTNLFGAF